MLAPTVLAVIQFVERLDHFQSVLVNCVVVIEIVLDQKADAAKFGQIASKESHLVHQSQHVCHAAASPQQPEKGIGSPHG